VFLVLFLAHPYLLTLPGRIGEFRFEHGLRVGMTRVRVQQLWNQTGDGSDPTDEGSNTLGFSFTDFGTLCIEGGQHYSVRLDKSMRVQSWSEEPWNRVC
jgi:hypothetical protein